MALTNRQAQDPEQGHDATVSEDAEVSGLRAEDSPIGVNVVELRRLEVSDDKQRELVEGEQISDDAPPAASSFAFGNAPITKEMPGQYARSESPHVAFEGIHLACYYRSFFLAALLTYHVYVGQNEHSSNE